MVQFNWKGTWLPNLPYNENVVVEYNSVNYISNQFVPPIDNGTAYLTNTFVTYENVLYVSLNPNISSTPSSGNTDWDIVVYGQGSTYIERVP